MVYVSYLANFILYNYHDYGWMQSYVYLANCIAMRGDHCQNITLYKIIYSDHLITGLQVRQQTVRIHKQPSDMFKWIEFAMHISHAALIN